MGDAPHLAAVAVTLPPERDSPAVVDPVVLTCRLAYDGRIRHVSPSAREILGVPPESLVGQHLRGLLHPADAELLGGRAGVPAGSGGVVRMRHRQGHWVWLDSTVDTMPDAAGAPAGTVVRGRDVTDRWGGEQRVDHESRLEALGRLAAGLAHEINSPIQFVGDNTRFLASAYQDLATVVAVYRTLLTSGVALDESERLARMKAAEDDIELDYLQTEIPHAVEQTLAGIERVASIVRAMKTFSHSGQAEQVHADINEALAATATVAGHQVSTVADLVLDLGELPPVRCHVAGLNQAFLNLIVNAADAVADTGMPGVVTVATRREGGDVVVSITDTGTGIPDDVRPRIFEPFFTTKDVGRGSGQGLPLVRAVVHEGHGGTVSLDSAVGVGSTFTVRIPVDGIPDRG